MTAFLTKDSVTKKFEAANAQAYAMRDLIPNSAQLMDTLSQAAVNLNSDQFSLLAIQAASNDAVKAVNAVLDPTINSWLEAQNSWIRYAAAEKASGHNGQLAMARGCVNSDTPFFIRFAEMQARIKKMRQCSPADFIVLNLDLADLVSDVQSFKQGNWCRDCGTPIEDSITPANGGKPFKPTLCRECKHASREAGK